MASVKTDTKTLDPKKHADWEVAQDAETRMKTIYTIADEMGLSEREFCLTGITWAR